MLSNLARTHPCVAVDLLVGTKACPLLLARTSYPLANRGGTFLHLRARNITVFHSRRLDVQIDSIEQRPGNSLPITLNLERPTSAFALQITKITTRTRIHRCDQ